MPEPVLTDEERLVDVCVLGTGLTESLAAAALARHGLKVLHVDREPAYGGCWRALNLRELEAWAKVPAAGEALFDAAGDRPVDEGHSAEAGVAPASELKGLTQVALEQERAGACFLERSLDWDPFGAKAPEEAAALREELLRSSNGFSFDLVPRLLFGRSELVDVLVESGVARYLEFQGLKSARVLTEQGLASVPLTKSDIFQDKVLTLPEKRALMRFITSTASFAGSLAFESPARLGVDQARKVQVPALDAVAAPAAPDGSDSEAPWSEFLERQGLSPRLRDFLTYAICLWDWSEDGGRPGGQRLSTAEGLRLLGRFVSSLGLYGRGTSMPLLYPMYGTAEMAQGFTRMCAIHRGTYALRTSAQQLLAEGGDDGASWRVAGLVTCRGEVVRARSLIASCDHLQEAGRTEEAEAPGGSVCRRLVALLDCPPLGEEGLSLCVVPPASLEPPLRNVVQALQLGWGTGSCPRGKHLLYLSQAADAARAPDGGFDDLDRALEALLEQCGGRHQCLLRCRYLHRPRSTSRWSPGTQSGATLASCAEGRSLALVPDPPAVPQLLLGDEVGEARTLFMQAAAWAGRPPDPEDFLRKPEHVALEERGQALEELEHFNQQMQEAERPPLPAALDSALASLAEPPGAETAAEAAAAAAAADAEGPAGIAVAPTCTAEVAQGAAPAPPAEAAATEAAAAVSEADAACTVGTQP